MEAVLFSGKLPEIVVIDHTCLFDSETQLIVKYINHVTKNRFQWTLTYYRMVKKIIGDKAAVRSLNDYIHQVEKGNIDNPCRFLGYAIKRVYYEAVGGGVNASTSC